MVHFQLSIKADLENLTDLKVGNNYVYFIQFKCSGCGETTPKHIAVDPEEAIEVPESRSFANAVFSCKLCKRVVTISVNPKSITAYTDDQNGSFSPIMALEIRGGEPVDFSIQGEWAAKGAETSSVFAVKFEDNEFYDFDEKKGEAVSVTGLEARFKSFK